MKRPQVTALIVFWMFFAGCEKAEITAYRVPKETPRQVAAAPSDVPSAPSAERAESAGPAEGANSRSAMANTAVPTATGSGLTWKAPAHWTTKPGSAMRRGSYGVPGEGGSEADLSITAFPGDVGGELANVNRWRGQIDLDPISQSELATALTRFDRNGLKIAVFDATGPGDAAQRTLGAMIPHQGATWFFKLTGPKAIVAKEKPAFMAFLDSVKPAAP